MTYLVSPVDPAESRETILGLWRRNFPAASDDRFAWLYGSGETRACLLSDDSGTPVGAAGLMTRMLHTPEGVVRAGQAIDLNVDRDHRSLGPALSLARNVVRTASEQGYRLIYAFPNRDSEIVLRRVGYRELGAFERWVKVLRADAVVDRLRSPIARLATSAVSPLVNVALRAGSRETYCRRTAGVEIDVSQRFDASFDELWREGADRFDVIGQRTAAYLDWRFGQCPGVPHRVFNLADREGKLLAYLVFHDREGTIYVNDFFFADASVLPILLAEFLRFVRGQRATAVILVYLGPASIADTLEQFGFWRRPSPWKAMVWSASSHRLPLDARQWYLTRADVDTSV